MEEKDTVETVENETYYDGTTDEEYTAEEPDTEETEEPEETDEDVTEVEDDPETFEDEEDGEEAEEDPDEDDEEEPDESEGEPEKNIPEKEVNNELEEEVRALLAELGLKDVKDPKAELEKLVAEAKGVLPEKYREEKAAKKAENAKWQAQAAQDIAAIHKAYPGTKKYNHVWELPNALEFGRLMSEGKLSVTAAFAASHPAIAEAHSKRPARNGNLSGTKSHITSSVPKGAKDNSTPMSKSEMESYREMFPDLSKAQIKQLYKKIK